METNDNVQTVTITGTDDQVEGANLGAALGAETILRLLSHRATGLPRFELLPALVAELQAIDHDRSEEVAVLMLDIDGLKAVNDNLTHTTGNRVMALLGQVLKMFFRRDTDRIVSFGGDEVFVISLGCPQEQMIYRAEQARQMFKLLLSCPEVQEELRAFPYYTLDMIEAVVKFLDISYGCAVGPADQLTDDGVESLLTLADQRMYEQKAEHKRSR